jgi:hypothetical protein
MHIGKFSKRSENGERWRPDALGWTFLWHLTQSDHRYRYFWVLKSRFCRITKNWDCGKPYLDSTRQPQSPLPLYYQGRRPPPPPSSPPPSSGHWPRYSSEFRLQVFPHLSKLRQSCIRRTLFFNHKLLKGTGSRARFLKIDKNRRNWA